MKKITLNLYDTLKNLLSICADAVILDESGEILIEHCRPHLVEDDIPQEYYKCEVRAIGISQNYPEKVAIWVSQDSVISSIEEV